MFKKIGFFLSVLMTLIGAWNTSVILFVPGFPAKLRNSYLLIAFMLLVGGLSLNWILSRDPHLEQAQQRLKQKANLWGTAVMIGVVWGWIPLALVIMRLVIQGGQTQPRDILELPWVLFFTLCSLIAAWQSQKLLKQAQIKPNTSAKKLN
jgi:hypothetical protein